MPLRRRTAPSDRSAIVRLCLTLMRGGQRLRPRCSRAWAVLPSLPPTRRRRPCLGRSGSAAASSDRPLRRPQRRRLTRAVDTPPASRSERRTREAAELVGNALAAGHDVDALLPVILESAVTITGSAGARLVADGNEVARAGVIEERSRPLAIPLVAGSTGDGMLVLYPPPGRELDNDAVQLAEWLAGRASIALQNAHLHRLARQLAERLRVAAEGLTLDSGGAGPVPVRSSFGVASFPAEPSAASLMRAADRALYRAKAAGKNTVVVAEPHIARAQ